MNNPKNCTCSPYLIDSTVPVDFKGFLEDFKVQDESSGPGWANGTCTCKSCGVDFDWEYENLIYEKISLRIKS